MNFYFSLLPRILVLSLLFLGYASTSAQSTAINLRTEIEKIIHYDTNIPERDNKGFIIGIIDNDSTYIIPFDNVQINEDSLDQFSLFEIGGLSKVFASHLVTSLETSQQVNAQVNINDIIPQKYQNDRCNITLLDLMSHQAGMPKQPAGIGRKQPDPQDPYSAYTNHDVLNSYKNIVPNSNKFNYSHYNYALIEAILANKYDIDSLFEQEIREKLELQNTFLFTQKELEPGYNRAHIVSPPWTFEAYGLSLGIKSCLNDLLKFTKLQFDSDVINDRLHTPLVKTSISRTLKMGRAWYIFDPKKKFQVFTHAGRTGGHKSYIGFVKETNTGVVILSRSSVEIEDLGLLILRLINHTWKRKSNGKKI